MKQRLSAIRARMDAAAAACGRNPETVRLVAVTKTVPMPRIQQAISAGAAIVGENYIQEAREKFNAFPLLDVSWHFIGHLQSNKAKYAVRIFDLIHSVDSLKLAEALDKAAGNAGKRQDILLQVNVSGETRKSGVSMEEAPELVRSVAALPHLRVRGLMTMPPFFDTPESARPFFRALRELATRIDQAALPNVRMHELSMGMSGDYEVAIQEGATLVRIGTAIFGARR